MIIRLLEAKNLLSGTCWLPWENVLNESRTKAVQRILSRQYRTVTYAPDIPDEIKSGAGKVNSKGDELHEPQDRRPIGKLRKYSKQSGKKTRQPEIRYYGYFRMMPLKFEPIGLYIRKLFGDGIYYSNEDNDSVYLLVVFNNLIVPGTDVLLNKALCNELLEDNKLGGHYKNLPLVELGDKHAKAILKLYQSNQHQLKKKQYIRSISILVFILIILLIPLFFIIMG